ncbi:acyloxyacyl hydrolase [Desulfobulbus rhabdoformis]|uniref:acyloxyacyl hydrolase n=1 Tax=Desulfobulbus rhabdoformis TaxID=34032 RepID=UPI001963C720|nr:acyloxyacyl hydrolase [Desulfobulbus rhabdoformis]MBM9612932.1 acyloxyacyl hydrolase [Desulfobulbus rhabdoformis]
MIQIFHNTVYKPTWLSLMVYCAIGIGGGLGGPFFAPAAFAWDSSQDMWSLHGGYGQSIPGWGATEQRVQTIDVVGRYSHLTIDDVGSGWLKGNYSTLVELPLHFVTDPDTSMLVGINFLACYTFTANNVWQPYIFGGGGPVYSFADIPGMGARWNGNYQFALGVQHRLDSGRFLLFEMRYHHISNGGTEEPNDPLNSLKFLVGFSF